MLTQKYLDDLSFKIIGAAIEVNKTLGPGLIEQVYERCLIYELNERGLKVEAQRAVPIVYKGLSLDVDLRFDLLVEDLIVVENKAVEELLPIFEAKLLTYMKLLAKPKGILLNFNCTNIFKRGQKTFVNEYYAALPKK